MEQEVKLCDEVETVSEFIYLGDRVSASGGCEAAVTVGTRYGWVKLRECGELLYGRRFPLKLKEAVYKSYIRPAILYGCEAWCLKESEIGIFTKDSLSLLLQTTHINHPLSHCFTNLSSIFTQTTYVPCPNPHSDSPIMSPVISHAMLSG